MAQISSSNSSVPVADKCLVAVCQLTCQNDKQKNYEQASSIVREAAGAGCKLIFLPECFDMVCDSRPLTLEQSEPLDGPLVRQYRELAKQLQVHLFLGGLHERNAQDPSGKCSNAHIAIDSKGEIVSVYRKLHLFNLDVPGTRLVESDFSVAGDRVNPPVETPAGKVGLGICYDLRFAEFAISMAKAGASIITYPSAFTVKTGLAHWEALLRARAIETQCYVVAAAQTGIHNPKRSSYGHAMIVDPWGHIVAQCADNVGFAIAQVDQKYLSDVRRRLPVWTDRKPNAYGDVWPADQVARFDSAVEHPFGAGKVLPSQVFLRTVYSFAFVNHRPILDGHVLVASQRPVKKFTELSAIEVADLFQTVQRVQKAVEEEYGATSATVALQDGPDAGQSVEHVHVHVVPRKPNDFGGQIDKVYSELYQHDKRDSSIRSEEQMAKEAARLRSRFSE